MAASTSSETTTKSTYIPLIATIVTIVIVSFMLKHWKDVGGTATPGRVSTGVSYSSASTPALLEWTPKSIKVEPDVWSDSIPRQGPGRLENFTLPPDLIACVTIKNAVTGATTERELFPQGGMFPAGWDKVKFKSKTYGVEITLMVQNPLPPR